MEYIKFNIILWVLRNIIIIKKKMYFSHMWVRRSQRSDIKKRKNNIKNEYKYLATCITKMLKIRINKLKTSFEHREAAE